MHAQTGFVPQKHYAQGNTKKWLGGTAAVQRVTLAYMFAAHSLQSKVDPRSKPAYGGLDCRGTEHRDDWTSSWRTFCNLTVVMFDDFGTVMPGPGCLILGVVYLFVTP